MLDERIEHSQEGWPVKLLHLTRGNQTLDGAVVIAVLGRVPPSRRQCFASPTAIIDADGQVRCPFIDRNGEIDAEFIVGTTIELRDNMRQLCDAAKLSDDERRAFFEALGKWIEKDYRATSSADPDFLIGSPKN